MAVDPNTLRFLKAYLRRRYAADLNGLRKLANDTFSAAVESVTINSHTFVDGSSSGEITCPKVLLLGACEEVLQELDTTAPRPSIAAVVYFRPSSAANCDRTY